MKKAASRRYILYDDENDGEKSQKDETNSLSNENVMSTQVQSRRVSFFSYIFFLFFSYNIQTERTIPSDWF
jgi:hypothetical protein